MDLTWQDMIREHDERVAEQMRKTREAAGHVHAFQPVGDAEMCACGVSRRPL